MDIVFKVNGTEQVIELFDGVEERLADDTDAMRAASLVGLRRAQLTIEQQNFLPLSDATIKRRRNKDSGSIQILRDSGLLMQSLTPEDDGNEYSIREFQKHLAVVGTNRPGAESHQLGLGNNPLRQFMVILPEDRRDMAQIYIDHLMGFGEPA